MNPALYRQLCQRFGEVKVANRGQRRVERTVADILSPRGNKVIVDEKGEQYKLCCPYCGDRRFRLYVSYLWCTLGPTGERQGQRLIHCFNEDCDMRDFEDELKPYITRGVRLTASNKPSSQVPKVITWPGNCVPVDTLPVEHPAIQYLWYERGFHPGRLAKEWGVRFCTSTGEDSDGNVPGTKAKAWAVRNRIIIPFYKDGKMVMWQARRIDHKKELKYYNTPGAAKAELLYNGDRASRFNFGIVVEGVTDAWRVGPAAVAVMGKTLSFAQRGLLVKYFGQRGLGLMLDGDAPEDLEKAKQLFAGQSFKNGLFTVKLPADMDPGDYPSRKAIWDVIRAQAKEQSIVLQ